MKFFWVSHFEFFKKSLISMKTSSPFIWGIIYFCNMDSFFRILEKTSSELICTRLYFKFHDHWKYWWDSPSELILVCCVLYHNRKPHFPAWIFTKELDLWKQKPKFCVIWENLNCIDPMKYLEIDNQICNQKELWSMVFCYQNCSDLLWEKMF